MIQVADNFNYRGKKPNFDRDSFDTLQDMKNYSENSLDDGHICYCKETNKHYKFNSNNQSDPTTGKWVEQHEAVPADEEDITEQNGTLQLANKTYDKQSFSGLGRVYLRKNIVGDKNVLTQAMINKANTIYVIQYDYDLKEASINIPENCVLQFDGGSLSNGTIVGNNTKIKTELEKIFNNITIDGNWNVVEAHPEWFGALPDGIYDCTDIIPTDLSKDFCKDKKGIYGKVADNTYDINLGIIRFNNAISDSPESYEYIKITKVPTSGFTFLYSTYNILSKYSLLYLDNKLYILSDVYDTGNDSFLNIKYLFDSISYTLDIYIKVPTKYGKLIVRDTKWANLNTYQWYSKNTDPYPSEAVDAEFISPNVLTLPNTLIGTKTYDKFGNELTWSKSDWLNPDGSLVTKVIFASKLNDFTKNNTIYNIVRYIDLKGETLTIPENSVLNFIGGAIGNGAIIGNKTKVINLNVDRIVLSGTWFDSGTTSNRPTNVLVGFQYFDTTINKPIFWDGSKWIDATGATV